MNTHIIKKNTFTIKKQTLAKTLGLIFSVAYGFYIVAVLQLQFFLGSGDIGAYVFYFEDSEREYEVLELGSGSAFRLAVLTLSEFFSVASVTVLSYVAFITSSIIFYIYSRNIRSEKYLIYILPLFLMVFFTPNVQFLFSSGIRSGIAFTILMVAFIYFKGVGKYILFGLSSLIHLSMLPILSLYYLFYMLNNKRIKSSFISSLFLLLLGSFLVVIAGSIFAVSTSFSQSISYIFLIVYVALLIIFINKKAIKNVYGFMSVGLILIVLSGIIIDVSFIRYVGNAIILYLFFLINKGEAGTIQIFTFGYAPLFILTLFYSITNLQTIGS